ncbi:MAG: response regulator [Caldilineaceae bacterium]|nr:response regulator [Caldilineaceae bacterium]
MYILYIEDNQNDADLTRRYLRRHAPQIKLELATTYAEAVAKLAQSTQDHPVFDLVLTDMRLPDGDGFKILAHIREAALPVPVIVLTGTGSEEIAIAALKGGADDYIAKRHDYLTRLPVLIEKTFARFHAAVARGSRPLRVLYAEAHQADIELTRRHLALHAPYIALDIVQSAPEVLDRLSADLASGEQADSYDLLLLDYPLPGMNTLDLLKELEYGETAQLLPKLPVVLMTGQGDEEVALQALRLGVTDYLVKNPGYLFQLPRTLENVYTQTLLQRERTALFESEQRYRALFDLAPVVIFTKDLQGVYTSSNAMMREVIGREPVGFTDAELFDAEIAEQLTHNDRAVIESGTEGLVEERVFTANADRYFLSRKSPLRDRLGNITGLLGIALELTERIHAQEAQREEQRRLAQLVEHVDEVIWLQETKSRTLLYISPAYAQVWGRSVASVYADPNSMIEAIDPEDQEQAQRFADALRQGHVAYVEFRVQRPDGPIVWVAAQTFPIHDEQGQIYRVAGVARDITEHRRSEEYLQQQERLVAVGQMAAGIAHDFNNILAIITLYTQMLQISVQQPTHQRHLATIYQQTLHAANLVQQILDFSRRSTMERVRMDVVPFIKELVKLWQRTLPENIRVELEVGSQPLILSVDPSRLQQALLNMAINARDAMPQGGILHVSVSPTTVSPGQPPPLADMSAGQWLCIGISDNGVGIPPGALPHIFDPFYTTKSPGMGTGLGLAQVYGIVRQLDGLIKVESQLGVGSFFAVYLPLIDQPANTLDERPTPPPRGQGETILLVEDEADLREAMAEMLTELGYAVLPAENGRHALSLFEQHKSPIAMVVSDLIMPDMGGKELYQHLVQEHANREPLRMLIVTGYPLEKPVQWQTGNGIVKWLQKPFAMDTFAHRVAETLLEG